MSTNGKPEFKPLESGDYLLRMNRIEEQSTKNGKGVMLKAGFEVVNGSSKGRLVFQNFLVEHENPKAADIGNKQLDQYLKAVGVQDGLEGIGHDRTLVQNFTELPFIANIGVEDAKPYKDSEGNARMSKPRNVIKKFSSR